MEEKLVQKIRDQNVDRLKLLQQYEMNKQYKKNLAYYKYSQDEEDNLNDRL